MEAGHIDETDPGNTSADPGADPKYFAKRRSNGEIPFGFAMDFTGTAADAPFLVLINIVATQEIYSQQAEPS
jgi:hypothetical protein